MAEKSSPHAGHRERMRTRLKASSPAAFAEHEILEMLLYYTNARGDTNETAHALIEAFGSIEGILDADVARLESVWGIGESSAIFLSLVGEAARRYTIQKISGEQKPSDALDSHDKLVAFFLPRFLGISREMVYALLLDNSMRPLDCFPVGDGSVSSVPLSVRSVAERAYTKHAAAVVLAHNHPGGVAVASTDDVNATHRIKEALSLLDIPLLEHFVLTDNSYTTILNCFDDKCREGFAASPIFDHIKAKFYQKKGDRL